MDELWLKIEAALRPYISDPVKRNGAINDLEALFEAEADYYETAIKDLGLLAETNEANWRDADRKLAYLQQRYDAVLSMAERERDARKAVTA